MHELSLALNIVRIADETAQQHGAHRVRAIRVNVGELSGVDPQALESAFAIAQDQEGFRDCRLDISLVPIQMFCERCDSTCPVESPQALRCARCGAPAHRVVAGKDLEVVDVELVV